ncbi:GntR family transcriptional regulator [Streptomyces sp. NPDC127091]|uniref:GntR family transcriptional regulator n=1 Tax=Streptomyces sp. NPDC127091 TaxID=3347134 RepID=UPI00364CFF7B
MSTARGDRGTDTGAGSHYARIRKIILDGQSPPGTVLIPTGLSTQFNVSRTPVREALIRLEQEGLVTRATRGYVVRTRTPQEILEICEARIALESWGPEAGAAPPPPRARPPRPPRATDLDGARIVLAH